MKLIAEIIYGPHKAWWLYNTAKFDQNYYLILGYTGLDFLSLVGFEIDRNRIGPPVDCSPRRYADPIEPAKREAVLLPAEAMRYVRMKVSSKDEAVPGLHSPLFLIEADHALFLVFNESGPDGSLEGYRIDPGKVIPPADSRIPYYTYAETLDFKKMATEVFPAVAMLDRVTVERMASWNNSASAVT